MRRRWRSGSTVTCRKSPGTFSRRSRRRSRWRTSPGNFFFGIYRTQWKYAGAVDAINIVLSIGVVSIFLLRHQCLPRPAPHPADDERRCAGADAAGDGRHQVRAAADRFAEPVRRVRRGREEHPHHRRGAHGAAAGAGVHPQPPVAVPAGGVHRRRPAAARRAHPFDRGAGRPVRHRRGLREEARRSRRAGDPFGERCGDPGHRRHLPGGADPGAHGAGAAGPGARRVAGRRPARNDGRRPARARAGGDRRGDVRGDDPREVGADHGRGGLHRGGDRAAGVRLRAGHAAPGRRERDGAVRPRARPGAGRDAIAT